MGNRENAVSRCSKYDGACFGNLRGEAGAVKQSERDYQISFKSNSYA